MKLKSTVLAFSCVLLASAPALADLQPDPCMGKAKGDACTTYSNKPGTCVPDANQPFGLACQENGTAGSGGSGGTGSSSSSSSASSESNASSAAAGGTGGGTGDEDEGGCSFRSGQGAGAAFGAAAAMIAAGILLARRRQKR